MTPRRSRTLLRSGFALFFALLFLFPLVAMVLGSFRQAGLPPPDGFELLPETLRPDNYRFAFLTVPLWTYLANSTVVVLIAVPVTVLFASWAGFAIVSAAPRTRRIIIAASVVAFLIPATSLWIPRFALYRVLGLTDTAGALIAPALMATTPFFVLLFALGYWRVPKNLYEAARLEGLSPFAVWRKVAWPLARPVAAAVAVLAFAYHWANFIDPLLYISSPERFTVPMGLRELESLEATNHPLLLAASVVATLPPVVAFLLAQRAFFTKTLGVR